jgi:hypothetical protein
MSHLMHLLMLTGLKMGPLLNYLRDCLLFGFFFGPVPSLGLSLFSGYPLGTSSHPLLSCPF